MNFKELGKILLANYWYVPQKTLKCFLTESNTYAEDQTLWNITNFNDGYIQGIEYTTINNIPVASIKFNGSIDKSGNVLISFEGKTTITGYGHVKKHKDT